jgi:hypothetical protein
LAFCAEADIDLAAGQDFPIICQPANKVSDDEEDFANKYANDRTLNSSDNEEISLMRTTFKLDGPKGRDAPVIVEDEEDHQPTNLAAEMLQCHQKFGHTLFKKMQEMAKLGIIPKKNCPVPACLSCQCQQKMAEGHNKQSMALRSSNGKQCA